MNFVLYTFLMGWREVVEVDTSRLVGHNIRKVALKTHYGREVEKWLQPGNKLSRTLERKRRLPFSLLVLLITFLYFKKKVSYSKLVFLITE